MHPWVLVRQLDNILQAPEALQTPDSGGGSYVPVPGFGTVLFGGVLLLLLVIMSIARWRRYRRRAKSDERAA